MTSQIDTLITGSEGFSGRSMYDFLSKENNINLSCLGRKQMDRVNYSQVDLTNRDKTFKYFSSNQFNQVYHFAGTYSNDFEIDIKSNVNSTYNLIEAILASRPATKIFLVGSASEYGEPQSNPVNESHPLRPLSPYGLSKQFQTNMMQYFVEYKKANIVMARTFNLFGKGMSQDLFVGRLYSQIELFKKNAISSIELGNLENKRDYIHIDKALLHYVKIMNSGKSGEIYNVGTGLSVRIRDFLSKVLREEGLDESIIVSKLPAIAPKVDILDIYADITKLKSLG
jgi:nucleoside-diphosphate-sugar epimerase